MSTSNQPAGSAPVSSLLNILQASNGWVSLGITVAGVAIPLIKALVAKIESIGEGTTTITFSNLVTQDLAELDAVTSLAAEDQAAINAELKRLGLPTLPALPPPAS